jgi:hypothetical protein
MTRQRSFMLPLFLATGLLSVAGTVGAQGAARGVDASAAISTARSAAGAPAAAVISLEVPDARTLGPDGRAPSWTVLLRSSSPREVFRCDVDGSTAHCQSLGPSSVGASDTANLASIIAPPDPTRITSALAKLPPADGSAPVVLTLTMDSAADPVALSWSACGLGHDASGATSFFCQRIDAQSGSAIGPLVWNQTGSLTF